MRHHLMITGLVALSATLFGCGDPLEGEWRSEEKACADLKRHEFTLDGDLVGDGEFVVGCFQQAPGNAARCKADVEGIERKEGRYDLEIDVGYCEVFGEDIGKWEWDCELRKDDEQLRCTSGASVYDFERVE